MLLPESRRLSGYQLGCLCSLWSGALSASLNAGDAARCSQMGSKSDSQVLALLLMKAWALQIQIAPQGCATLSDALPLHLLVPCILFS